MEQQLILVDEKDKFFGKYASKGKCHFAQGLHHLAFTLMILNDKGEVLLQERKHELWDHFWDLTNSHPLHLENGRDETIKEAVSRCLKGEWGVDFPVETLFAFNYFAQYKNDFCENEYCYFLLGKYNGEVFPAEKVAYGYKWMLLGKLETDIKTHPETYTPWLIRSMEELKKRDTGKLLFFKNDRQN